ncbi:MAG: Dyp-type peroxidase [Rickettsiales bacterium]
MSTPQSGIFAEGSSFHHFLEYTIGDGFDGAAVSAAREAFTSLTVNGVVAFGPAAWSRLSDGHAPAALAPFEKITGAEGRVAPATQRDLLIWLHGGDHDNVLDAAFDVQRRLSAHADIKLDLPGFQYRDSRDLTGFIDGSANPKGGDRQAAALVPDGEAGAGGAYVLSQKWVHDLDAFNQLSVPEQEGVIGRTKADSIELEGEAMPPDSHISRTDVKIDGKGLKIYRRSAPYGTVTEKGLYFIAFSCDPSRFDVMLRRMYGIWDDNLHDHLIHFSAPVTGSYWFAPSEEDLEAAGCAI